MDQVLELPVSWNGKGVILWRPFLCLKLIDLANHFIKSTINMYRIYNFLLFLYKRDNTAPLLIGIVVMDKKKLLSIIFVSLLTLHEVLQIATGGHNGNNYSIFSISDLIECHQPGTGSSATKTNN